MVDKLGHEFNGLLHADVVANSISNTTPLLRANTEDNGHINTADNGEA